MVKYDKVGLKLAGKKLPASQPIRVKLDEACSPAVDLTLHGKCMVVAIGLVGFEMSTLDLSNDAG